MTRRAPLPAKNHSIQPERLPLLDLAFDLPSAQRIPLDPAEFSAPLHPAPAVADTVARIYERPTGYDGNDRIAPARRRSHGVHAEQPGRLGLDRPDDAESQCRYQSAANNSHDLFLPRQHRPALRRIRRGRGPGTNSSLLVLRLWTWIGPRTLHWIAFTGPLRFLARLLDCPRCRRSGVVHRGPVVVVDAHVRCPHDS